MLNAFILSALFVVSGQIAQAQLQYRPSENHSSHVGGQATSNTKSDRRDANRDRYQHQRNNRPATDRNSDKLNSKGNMTGVVPKRPVYQNQFFPVAPGTVFIDPRNTGIRSTPGNAFSTGPFFAGRTRPATTVAPPTPQVVQANVQPNQSAASGPKIVKNPFFILPSKNTEQLATTNHPAIDAPNAGILLEEPSENAETSTAELAEEPHEPVIQTSATTEAE